MKPTWSISKRLDCMMPNWAVSATLLELMGHLQQDDNVRHVPGTHEMLLQTLMMHICIQTTHQHSCAWSCS